MGGGDDEGDTSALLGEWRSRGSREGGVFKKGEGSERWSVREDRGVREGGSVREGRCVREGGGVGKNRGIREGSGVSVENRDSIRKRDGICNAFCLVKRSVQCDGTMRAVIELFQKLRECQSVSVTLQKYCIFKG